MKRILFIRHAKSSHSDGEISDHERSLNEIGLIEAQNMGKLLLKEKIIPEIYLSSSAKRAKDTCQIIMNQIDNVPLSRMEVNQEIYSNGLLGVANSIKNMDLIDDINFIAIFGHNPTFEIIYNKIKGTNHHKFPTCAMVLCSFNAEKWIDFSIESSTFIYYNYPENIKNYFK